MPPCIQLFANTEYFSSDMTEINAYDDIDFYSELVS